MDEIHVLYEDNHIIAVNKLVSDLVQGDITGDISLDKKVKQYLKKKYSKPGNVFLGVTHRLDRPVSGVVVFARTSKALSRINTMFRQGEVDKTYWAVVANKPEKKSDILVHFLRKNQKQNKSYPSENELKGSKLAKLRYELIACSDRYYLLEIKLYTGRHHQIRCQLAAEGLPVKGDLKYGYPRSNKNGGIHLHAREISFIHPVQKNKIKIVADLPEDTIWNYFTSK